MRDIVETIVCICMLVGVWGGWIFIPSLITYLFLCKWRKGLWHFPYSYIDFIALCLMSIIWWHGVRYDYNHRGMGRFVDLMVMGLTYSMLLAVRLPILWWRPQWRMRIAGITLIVVLTTTVIITWCINLGGE